MTVLGLPSKNRNPLFESKYASASLHAFDRGANRLLESYVAEWRLFCSGGSSQRPHAASALRKVDDSAKWQCLIALLEIDATYIKKQTGETPTKRYFIEAYPELTDLIVGIPIECFLGKNLPTVVDGYTTLDLVHVTEAFLVYLVRAQVDNKDYTAKVCRKPENQAALRREASLLNSLTAKGVPKLKRFALAKNGLFCLIVDAIRGKTLHALRYEFSNPDLILDIALQVLDSLQEIHQNGYLLCTPLCDNIVVDGSQAMLSRLDELSCQENDNFTPSESSYLFEIGQLIAWFVFSDDKVSTLGGTGKSDYHRLETLCRSAISRIQEATGPFSSPQQLRNELGAILANLGRTPRHRRMNVLQRRTLFVAATSSAAVIITWLARLPGLENWLDTSAEPVAGLSDASFDQVGGELLASPLVEEDLSLDVDVRLLPPSTAFASGYGVDYEYQSFFVARLLRNLPLDVQLHFSVNGTSWRTMRKNESNEFSTVLHEEEMDAKVQVRVVTTNGVVSAVLCQTASRLDLSARIKQRKSKLRGDLTFKAKSTLASSPPFTYAMPNEQMMQSLDIEIVLRAGWLLSYWLLGNRTSLERVKFGDNPDALSTVLEFNKPSAGGVEVLPDYLPAFPRPLAEDIIHHLATMNDTHRLHYEIHWIDGTKTRGYCESGVPPHRQGVDFRPGFGGGTAP